MYKIIGLVVAGYLLGNIPFSFIVGQRLGNVDIRKHGSGNTGATNVYRVLGVKAGLWAFLGDFIKGLLSAIIGRVVMGPEGAAICGGMAMVGHCYPVTLGFKGGKGVAASGGLVFGLNPIIGLILLVVQVAIMKVTRYVSLASIITAGLLPLLTLLFNMSTEVSIYSLLIGGLIIFRHRSNIQRLLKGEESKITKSK